MEDQIPLRTLSAGEWKYHFEDSENAVSNRHGALYVSEDNTRLEVVVWQDGDVTSQPADRKAGPCGTFTCTSITAVDLKLDCKFASDLDSMCVRLIVETESPVRFTKEQSSNERALPSDVGFLFKTTCDVSFVSQIRDILRNIRYAKFKSSLAIDGDVSCLNSQIDKVDVVAWKEGLPGWVSMIPFWMYSQNVRSVVERLIIVYTILSVAWAMWQLYIHIPLIKTALHPIVELLNMYLQSVMSLFDWILHHWTDLWLYYCQPVVVIWASFIGPVSKAVRHLSMPVMRAAKPIIISVQKLPWRNVMQIWIPIHRFLGVLLIPITKLLAVLQRFQVSVIGFDPSTLRLRFARQLLLTGLRTVGLGTRSLAERAYKKQQHRKQLQKDISHCESDGDEPSKMKTD